MARRLLDCPVEICRLILAFLPSADLYNVCLAHRVLRTVAEPLLYYDIQLTWMGNWTPPIISLLRGIIRRPQLGGYVRNLSLKGDTFEMGASRFWIESPKVPVADDGTDLDELVECIRRLNVPYGTGWIQKLRSGTMDAFVALLISQLPHLTVLRLHKNFTRRSKLVGRLFRSACSKDDELNESSQVPSFEHLREVYARYFPLGYNVRQYTDARNTNDVLPLFYLPSVERLVAPIDIPPAFSWPVAHPPDPRNLRSLALEWVREGHLGQILSVTTGLRSLHWNWYYRPDLEDRVVTDVIDLDQIGADISHVGETLTDLSIFASCVWADGEPWSRPVTIKGSHSVSFSHLDRLRSLEAPLPFLLGTFAQSRFCGIRLAEALPRNIEYLTINDDLSIEEAYEFDDVQTLEVLRSWWMEEGWKQRTPRLKQVHLLLSVIHAGEWDDDKIEQLSVLGARAGLLVGVTGEFSTAPPMY